MQPSRRPPRKSFARPVPTGGVDAQELKVSPEAVAVSQTPSGVSKGDSPSLERRPDRRWRRFVFAGAAAAVLLAVGIGVGQYRHHQAVVAIDDMCDMWKFLEPPDQVTAHNSISALTDDQKALMRERCPQTLNRWSIWAAGNTPDSSYRPVPTTGVSPSTQTGGPSATAASGAASDSLTGFGATAEAWDANHIPDNRYAPGAVYNPDPSLSDGSPESTDKYFSVGHLLPRITSYVMRAAPGTTVQEAKSLVMHEFPLDATETWFKDKGTCAQMAVHSDTLQRVAGDELPTGDAFVEFTSGQAADSYDSTNVTNLTFAIGDSTDAASGC